MLWQVVILALVEVDSLVEVAGGAKATSTLASDLVLSFFGFLFFSNKNALPNSEPRLAEMECLERGGGV
jgi:hypothetical protein